VRNNNLSAILAIYLFLTPRSPLCTVVFYHYFPNCAIARSTEMRGTYVTLWKWSVRTDVFADVTIAKRGCQFRIYRPTAVEQA